MRLLLRVGLGVSLFVLLITFRSCPLRQTALERELAQWEQGQAADEAAVIGAEAARTWIEGGNHQFRDPSSGEIVVDKDPIRGLISRLHRLGAREVYVHGLQTIDLVVFAAGLDVVLPDDQAQRSAIFLEEARFHRRDAPTVPDTGQARLRISVP